MSMIHVPNGATARTALLVLLALALTTAVTVTEVMGHPSEELRLALAAVVGALVGATTRVTQ